MTERPSAPSTEDFQRTERFLTAIRDRVGTVVVGQEVVVERLLIALFTGGHLLLQGVPGLAKTLLVSALSKSIDLDFARVQFTIDLLPSDTVDGFRLLVDVGLVGIGKGMHFPQDARSDARPEVRPVANVPAAAEGDAAWHLHRVLRSEGLQLAQQQSLEAARRGGEEIVRRA
jgi:hypothetical protein